MCHYAILTYLPYGVFSIMPYLLTYHTYGVFPLCHIYLLTIWYICIVRYTLSACSEPAKKNGQGVSSYVKWPIPPLCHTYLLTILTLWDFLHIFYAAHRNPLLEGRRQCVSTSICLYIWIYGKVFDCLRGGASQLDPLRRRRRKILIKYYLCADALPPTI